MRGDGMDSVCIIMGWWGRALRGSGQSAAARIRCWSLVNGLIVKGYQERSMLMSTFLSTRS